MSVNDQLAVYEIVPDHVIAFNEDDAWSLWCKHYQEKRENYAEEPCTRVDDTYVLRIFVDEAGNLSDAGEVVALTAREWVKRCGRGFLCSSEF